jgi:hypothetical protein
MTYFKAVDTFLQGLDKKERRLKVFPPFKQNALFYCIHILRRNCLLQRVIEGKIKGGIKVTGRRGRRRRMLLYDLKERTGNSHLKEEALARTMRRARFGRSFGPVVRQTSI